MWPHVTLCRCMLWRRMETPSSALSSMTSSPGPAVESGSLLSLWQHWATRCRTRWCSMKNRCVCVCVCVNPLFYMGTSHESLAVHLLPLWSIYRFHSCPEVHLRHAVIIWAWKQKIINRCIFSTKPIRGKQCLIIADGNSKWSQIKTSLS